MPAPTATASIEARTVVTWAGAALLLAGALAFATVIWRQAGESGRLAILAAVTLLAFAGADRLRRMTPTTAEAFTAIAAGMVVVNAVSAQHGGYAFGWHLTAWFAVTLLPAGLPSSHSAATGGRRPPRCRRASCWDSGPPRSPSR